MKFHSNYYNIISYSIKYSQKQSLVLGVSDSFRVIDSCASQLILDVFFSSHLVRDQHRDDIHELYFFIVISIFV